MVFCGMMAVNYISNRGVADVFDTLSEEIDLSEYGIYVNADGDDIEEEEQQLRSHVDINQELMDGRRRLSTKTVCTSEYFEEN